MELVPDLTWVSATGLLPKSWAESLMPWSEMGAYNWIIIKVLNRGLGPDLKWVSATGLLPKSWAESLMLIWGGAYNWIITKVLNRGLGPDLKWVSATGLLSKFWTEGLALIWDGCLQLDYYQSFEPRAWPWSEMGVCNWIIIKVLNRGLSPDLKWVSATGLLPKFWTESLMLIWGGACNWIIIKVLSREVDADLRWMSTTESLSKFWTESSMLIWDGCLQLSRKGHQDCVGKLRS